MTVPRLFKAALLSCLLLGSATAGAADYRAGSLRIEQPWSIATPNGAKVGVGYLQITNDGTQPDRLIGISSTTAPKVSIHDMVKDGDVMRMRAMGNGIEIKPGETVELAPGGKHVMFEQLAAPLAAGTDVKATLQFEKAGNVDVEFSVQPMGTRAAPPATAMHHH